MFELGQKVIFSPRVGPDVVLTVERVTKSHAIAGKEKFWQSNGRGVGNPGCFIRLGTPMEIAAVEQEGTRRRMAAYLAHQVNWWGYPLDTLKQIQCVLSEARKAVEVLPPDEVPA